MASIGIWFSSSARRTPTCAMPRAAPPESANPMRGRSDLSLLFISQPQGKLGGDPENTVVGVGGQLGFLRRTTAPPKSPPNPAASTIRLFRFGIIAFARPDSQFRPCGRGHGDAAKGARGGFIAGI